MQAHLLKDHLAEHGIEVDVFDAHAVGARGELAAIVYPRIVLRDPAQHDAARALIAQWEAGGDAPDWPCPCGESNPAMFETCWACDRERN